MDQQEKLWHLTAVWGKKENATCKLRGQFIPAALGAEAMLLKEPL
jgi:hypothetical protein